MVGRFSLMTLSINVDQLITAVLQRNPSVFHIYLGRISFQSVTGMKNQVHGASFLTCPTFVRKIRNN